MYNTSFLDCACTHTDRTHSPFKAVIQLQMKQQLQSEITVHSEGREGHRPYQRMSSCFKYIFKVLEMLSDIQGTSMGLTKCGLPTFQIFSYRQEVLNHSLTVKKQNVTVLWQAACACPLQADTPHQKDYRDLCPLLVCIPPPYLCAFWNVPNLPRFAFSLNTLVSRMLTQTILCHCCVVFNCMKTHDTHTLPKFCCYEHVIQACFTYMAPRALWARISPGLSITLGNWDISNVYTLFLSACSANF